MEEQRHEVEKKRKAASPFRIAERCLYDYKKNLARLNILREDLRTLKAMPSVKVQDFELDDIILSAGGHSDPVMARLIRIEQLENEIAWLDRRTKPITRFVEDLKRSHPVEGSLKADFLILLKNLYFEEHTPEEVVKLMGVGRSLFYKRKQELVKNICLYLGL